MKKNILFHEVPISVLNLYYLKMLFAYFGLIKIANVVIYISPGYVWLLHADALPCPSSKNEKFQLMLGHGLQCWLNINLTIGECLVFE